MNGFWNAMKKLACIFAAAGVALAITGFAMGGRPVGIEFSWNGLRPTLHYTQGSQGAARKAAPAAAEIGSTPANADTIHSLNVDVGGAQVTVLAGDTYNLTVSGTNDYTSTVSNGVWEIENDGAIFTSQVRFTITLPRDTALQHLQLTLGGGVLEASDLVCRTADLQVGAGKMTLKNITASDSSNIEVGAGSMAVDGALHGVVSVDCGMGAAKLSLQRPEAYGYRVDSGMSSVRIDGHSFSGLGSDVAVNEGAADFFEVDCGMGSVEISFY